MSDEIKNAEEKAVQDEIEQTEDVSVNEQSSDEKVEGILGEYNGKKSAKAKKEKDRKSLDNHGRGISCDSNLFQRLRHSDYRQHQRAFDTSEKQLPKGGIR